MWLSGGRSIAHQAADFDILAERVDRGQPMVRRQRDELHATAVEQWIGTDHECVGPLLQQAHEGRINVASAPGIENFDLLTDGRSGGLRISDQGLGIAIVWIDQYGKAYSTR